MKTQKVWINSRLVDARDAKVSVFDRGLLYGDGIFETMRSYAGVVFKIDKHLDRLFNSMKFLRINPPYSKAEFENGIYRMLKSNNLKNAYIRLTVTRGENKSNAVIIARDFEGYPGSIYKYGITAKIADTRQNEYSPIVNIKTLNFLNYIMSKEEAKRDGFDDAILINTKGYVAEAATSNVFIVKKDSLITPAISCGILPGITRAVVIEIAKRLKMKTIEKCCTVSELLNSNEVLLTNSCAEVVPVVKVGSKCIGSGKPGELTKLLHISYQKEVIRAVIR
ncbi:MAG: aminotransferase class IV [Candidatus Omnitrophota bacterium]|jgi:branched-chain amino acid aminotransferase